MPFLAEHHMEIPNKDVLSWIFDVQGYDQDKPIYIDALDPSRSISSRQARELTRRLCAGYKALGLKEGDCVCTISFNDIYYPLTFLSALSFGGIFTGTNPSFTVPELTHAFTTAAVRALIVSPALLPTALAAARAASIPLSNIFAFDTATPHTQAWRADEVWGEGLGGEERWGGVRSWRWLMAQGESDWVRWEGVEGEKGRGKTAARLFSSGTTGKPKAVEVTHGNFLAQHEGVLGWGAEKRDYEIKRLLATPLFHISNVPRAHTSPLHSGFQTYILPRFHPETYLTSLTTHSITEASLVPPMVITLLNSPSTSPAHFLTIRNAWVGAAPLAAAPQARFKALLPPGTPFNQVWGMSETSCIASMIHYPEHDATGSVGRMLPNMDAKLVDDAGNDITDYNVRGELCVRGPCVVKGYFRNEEANREAWDGEGYFHTGDVALRRRENGLWYIVGRKKELVKVRGFQVAPAELEGVLLGHPAVEDVAVIGVPVGGAEGESGSEVPRGYVVVKAGEMLDEEGVRRWMKERLAGYKQLDGGVVFVESIEKNASGKVLKGVLRERARREMGGRL